MTPTHLMSLAAALALAVGGASAQSTSATGPKEITPERAPSATKHGGTYHLTTGTWTRGGGKQAASIGPHIIYSNTAPSGYFSTAGVSGGFAPGSRNFDEGALPGPFNAGPFASPPLVDEYNVNCVTIGYCDLGAPGTSGFELSFFGQYTPCTVNATPDATIMAMGLPAGGGCWTIDLDLSGGAEFCMPADGEGVFDDDLALDSFGWSFEYAGAAGNVAGFLLAGNPDATDPGFTSTGALTASNTYFGSTLCPGLGTGYQTQDFWWLQDPTGASSNCLFFGGYANGGTGCGGPVKPLSSFHLELSSDLNLCESPSSCKLFSLCFSNPNSLGVRSSLCIEGSSFAADDDATLVAQVPPDVFGFFITSPTLGFVANPAGSAGNLCLGGQIGRFVAPGQIKNSGASGEIALSTSLGEWSLASIPSANGFYAATPGATTNFQLWHRDLGPTSNFTDSITVTWQ